MNKKRGTALLLAMIMTVMPVMSVRADETEQTQEEQRVISLEEANQTLENYEAEEMEWEEIYIDSVEDLQTFAHHCTLDTWSQNKKVYLTADLNVAGNKFTSIPTFGGYFDGQGHTISGFTVKDGISYTGLFCYTQSSAVITNLNVTGMVKPSGKQLVVGGIVGDNAGIIMNCTFNGSVAGNDYVGGVTGYNERTGIIMNCSNGGTVTGAHYTGGIAGENAGNIIGCKNQAGINTTNEDKGMSLEDLNIQQYASTLLDLTKSDDTQSRMQGSASNNTIDSGGIAGRSTGIIQHCVNKGTVGYEHVGYNVGGIAGRQSGYVYDCENMAEIYGRKDVGGIAGQAEPYIAVDLSEDIVHQLTENINKFHDLIDQTLEDSGSESGTLSDRLSVIQSFADKALDNTSYLSDYTVGWVDEVVGAANELFDRADYVLDEAAKKDGVMDQTQDAAGNLKDAADSLVDVMDDLDVYGYMTEEEQLRYDEAKNKVADATSEYEEYYTDAVRAYDHYYMDEVRNTNPAKYMNADAPTEQDLNPYDESGAQLSITWSSGLSSSEVIRFYKDVDSWKHVHPDGSTTDFLSGEEESQYQLDQDLREDVNEQISDHRDDIRDAADNYAGQQYRAKHGKSYKDDVNDAVETMYDITIKYANQMSDQARDDAEAAFKSASDAAGNMEQASSETKRITDNINERDDIVMPKLGDEYRMNSNDLTANLQGISENMGYLNDEMLSASDVLVDDMEAVNDQFSTLMLLYTDAIDGVLEMDYTSTYEDTSEENAETSTDATLAQNTNYGMVTGDLNVSGIAGTMAIEYDFDLESDITGIDHAKINSTYLTRCVLRENVNQADVTAQKSDVGGISGKQELGMILRCENYGRVKSNSGDYVGGIAGESLSYIRESFAKCALSGEEYVGGIAGFGYRIENCYTMVRILETDAFSGAIAGMADDTEQMSGNYFVSDELAGIDRISYSEKAEPLSYEELLETEMLPDEFRKMKIIFYADDEEIARVSCNYDSSILESQYPEIPEKEGFYADWDKKELRNIRNDEDIYVEYVRYLTTLSGEFLRDSGQSAILADGQFQEGDRLTVSQISAADMETVPERTREIFTVNIPDDGEAVHQLRYQAPDGETKGLIMYVKNGDDWIRTDTELFGNYYVFQAEGNEVQLAISADSSNLVIYVVLGVLVVALLILAAVLIQKKKRNHAVKKEG